MDYKKRCTDCMYLIEKNGCWCCDECFGQKCEDIDDCPEGVTLEEIDKSKEMEKNAKKVKTYAQAETKKEHKPKERKVDTDKLKIMQAIKETVDKLGYDSILEKELYLHFDNYTLKLTRHKKKK